jgi:carbonic anhydrase
MRPIFKLLLVPMAAALVCGGVSGESVSVPVPAFKTSPRLQMNLGSGQDRNDDEIVTERADGGGRKRANTHGAKGAAVAASGASAPVGSMEHLRERLAEKLGAQPGGDGRSAYVMRVSTHGESGESTISSPRPSPEAVAAAQRRAEAAKAAEAARARALAWDYAGESGPESWARLAPEYAACGNGQRQSPIDIRGGIAVDLEPIRFDYRPSAFSVIDTGHTVEVDVEPGNSIQVMGRRFELVQFHFHRPSEERIDGRQYDMVVHLVHKDASGKLAVVAVLLDQGSAHPVVQAVWNNLPLEKREALRATTPIDLGALLPEDRRYYTYMGSLTTPPCSEGVLWMVMKQPVPVSSSQIGIFSRLYPMNARPVQQADGRLIKESN